MAEGDLIHVVGAGLAGLAAALSLCRRGRRVALYEAAPQAGGRCRSYYDSALSCRIDNGNHLLLSGNRAALSYVDWIAAEKTFDGPGEPVFAFADKASGERWSLSLGRGALPWWTLSRRRRVPGSRAREYLAPLSLRCAGPQARVADILAAKGALYRRLWEPLAVAALNTSAAEGSARLFWRVLEETLLRGGRACRPLLPREGLSESLVDPAVLSLEKAGCTIRFGARLRSLLFSEGRVSALLFEKARIALGEGEYVVLALPAAGAERLVPGLEAPLRFAPIVNAHFRVRAPEAAPPFIGLIGATAQWVFRKKEVVSVTVSAADDLLDEESESLKERLWRDAAFAYGLAALPLPAGRILKERRATFLASPEELERRPGAATEWQNLVLAGDYTDTGLPATIEGAIRSGFAAARLLDAGAGTGRQRTADETS